MAVISGRSAYRISPVNGALIVDVPEFLTVTDQALPVGSRFLPVGAAMTLTFAEDRHVDWYYATPDPEPAADA